MLYTIHENYECYKDILTAVKVLTHLRVVMMIGHVSLYLPLVKTKQKSHQRRHVLIIDVLSISRTQQKVQMGLLTWK